MTQLLEMRERLRSIYGRFEIYFIPAIRFVLALVAFLAINQSLGYMKKLANPVIPIVLALACTFFPISCTVLLAAVLILAHLAALSLEAAVIGLLLFVLMFLVYFRFVPKGSYSTLVTPLLYCVRIPQIVPTALGLGAKLHSVVAMVCGMITFYFLKVVKANDTLLAMAETEEETSKFSVLLHALLENQEMYVAIVAFVLTAIVIHVIRRQSVDYAWPLAIAIGNVLNLAILLAGIFILDTKENILWIFLGTAAAVVIGLLMQFFLFHLDYLRTERVQFEDDEYYYYVKAVPKVYVHSKEKKVKQINRRSINKKELAEEFDISQDLLDD